MLVRQHRGSLDVSMATAVELEPTIEALAKHVNDTIGGYLPKDVVPADLSFARQGYDARIGWETYLVKVAEFGVWGMLDGPPPTYPGSRLFELKATHGLPLEVAVERVLGTGVLIDWTSFISAARNNGWYDFQTIEVIENALTDAFVDRNVVRAVVTRCKLYILKNPMDTTK